jgi:hypothetical protein
MCEFSSSLVLRVAKTPSEQLYGRGLPGIAVHNENCVLTRRVHFESKVPSTITIDFYQAKMNLIHP